MVKCTQCGYSLVGELKKGSGTQFDPKVVETFLRLESAEWTLEAAAEKKS